MNLRLIELRENKGFTQKFLAKELNIDNTLYNKYEKNYNNIPLKSLINIAKYYNISLDYMFMFTDNQKQIKLPNIVKTKAGQRLKEFRKSQKLTQENLAIFLNTTHSVISDYDKGRYLINTEFLYALCTKYNVSADYLLGLTDKPSIS